MLEVIAEMRQCAAHRKGREATHRTQRCIGHDLAQVDQGGEVRIAIVTGDDLVDQLDASGAADAARSAFPA
jgi:hypothetical protein